MAIPRTVCIPLFTNWRDNATKLYLFLDDFFQPSPMLLMSVLLMIFSSPVHSSPVQSSPVIVDGHCTTMCIIKDETYDIGR